MASPQNHKNIINSNQNCHNGSYNMTWKCFEHNKLESISLISDPITGGFISKECFIGIYGSLLETLDGSDLSSYVDFFFEISPCNSCSLVFVDEDAQADFLDFAIDMKLIPEMFDIMRGEDDEDINIRKSQQTQLERYNQLEKERQLEYQRKLELEKSKQIQKLKNTKKMSASLNIEKKSANTQIQAQKSLDALNIKLESLDINSKERPRIEKKIDRIIQLLSNCNFTS